MFYKGRIVFDPKDHTNKHIKQRSWKKVAMVMLNSEIDGMWRWYLKKRFNLELNPPLRGSHISFINDRLDNSYEWEKTKSRLNGKGIGIEVSNKLRSNGEHWWLKIEDCEILDSIRRNLGLSDPYFSYHMTVGHANEKNLNHSQYIHELLIWNRAKL